MAESSKDQLSQEVAELIAKSRELKSQGRLCHFADLPLPISLYQFLNGPSGSFIIALKDRRVALLTPCANKVLDAFNSQNSTDYELVDCLDVCSSAENHGMLFHCNFTAKPKTHPFVAGDYSPKVFFAEIKTDDNDEKVPTSYSILHGVNTKLGCEMCHDVIAHPTSGPHEELHYFQFRPYFFRAE